MHRFLARRVCLGLIALASGCGSPGDLDRSQFPELEGTGYPDRVGAAGAGAGGTFPGTGGSNLGGAAAVGGTGAGVSGAGGTAPIGGAGSSPGVSGTGGQPGIAGQSGSTSQGGTGQGGTGPDPGGCPDDILVLLNRPAMQGGCAGDLCHIPGATPPDLTSPGIEGRILNVPASQACGGRPLVSADDSVIVEKITSPDPCGEPMPFFAEDRLTPADEACIVQWLDELAAGM